METIEDEETGPAPGGDNVAAAITKSSGVDEIMIQKQTAVFHWKDVCYDIKIKGQPRRLLDHVDGWVKPGTLTALMVTQHPNLRIVGGANAMSGSLWCWQNDAS
jgi:hypothetical protein